MLPASASTYSLLRQQQQERLQGKLRVLARIGSLLESVRICIDADGSGCGIIGSGNGSDGSSGSPVGSLAGYLGQALGVLSPARLRCLDIYCEAVPPPPALGCHLPRLSALTALMVCSDSVLGAAVVAGIAALSGLRDLRFEVGGIGYPHSLLQLTCLARLTALEVCIECGSDDDSPFLAPPPAAFPSLETFAFIKEIKEGDGDAFEVSWGVCGLATTGCLALVWHSASEVRTLGLAAWLPGLWAVVFAGGQTSQAAAATPCCVVPHVMLR